MKIGVVYFEEKKTREKEKGVLVNFITGYQPERFKVKDPEAELTDITESTSKKQREKASLHGSNDEAAALLAARSPDPFSLLQGGQTG